MRGPLNWPLWLATGGLALDGVRGAGSGPAPPQLAYTPVVHPLRCSRHRVLSSCALHVSCFTCRTGSLSVRPARACGDGPAVVAGVAARRQMPLTHVCV